MEYPPLNDFYPPDMTHPRSDSSRTMPSMTSWSTPWTVIGLLVLVTVPIVAGQRGFGVTGDTSPYKGYSGLRANTQANRIVFFHEQTIAVVEIGEKRELFNCELIEVYKPGELKMALNNLSSFAKPHHLQFDEMIELMSLCDQLRSPVDVVVGRGLHKSGRALPNLNPVTLLSGILPGTKWCGAGDLAENYFDLGAEATLDKCCRAHDLCPVKVRAYTSRYNLTNNSLYTKSHCTCDAILQKCLKSTNNPTADIMGNIYFNLLKVPCMRQGISRTSFQSATHYD